MENITTPIQEIHKPNYLNIFLISFAFILFSTGVYFLGKQSVKTPINTSVAVLPQTTASQTPTLVPNLKSYTDDALGISIQYPSKYIQTYIQETNYYALHLLGPDYGTEANDMGIIV